MIPRHRCRRRSWFSRSIVHCTVDRAGRIPAVMQLYPQDLSDNDHAQIVRKRAMTSSGNSGMYDPNAPLPEPKLGKLGRLWAKGLGMTDRQAAVGNANASSWTQSAAWTTAMLGATDSRVGIDGDEKEWT